MKTNTPNPSLAEATARSSTPHNGGITQETSWDAARNHAALARINRCTSGLGATCLLTFLLLLSEGAGFAASSAVHVDWQYPDTNSDGSPQRPFYTVEQGYGRVALGGTLSIHAGSYLAPMPLDRPLLLEAYDGPVRLGGSIGDGFSPDRLQRPGYPQHLRSILVANNGIRLDWDDTDREAGYRLHFEGTRPYYTSSSFSRNVGRGQESYTIQELSPGYTYCVSIEAFNRVGTSASSDEVCETIPDNDPPPVLGNSKLHFYNCNALRWGLKVWYSKPFSTVPTERLWSSTRVLPTQYSPSGCPAPDAIPIELSLDHGETYSIVAVGIDPEAPIVGCNGVQNPDQGAECVRFSRLVLGNDAGPILRVVGDAVRASGVAVSGGRLSNLGVSPASGFQFTFSEATAGESYRIQSSPSATSASWTDFTNFIYTGPIVITDGTTVLTTNKFYRAVTP